MRYNLHVELHTLLATLPKIGPSLSYRLKLLELFDIEDLLYHFPFRYDDFSQSLAISQVKVGESVTFLGEVWSIKNSYTRFHKVITRAILNDSTGTIELVWFNQPWLTKSIKTGDRLQVSGKVTRYGSKTSLVAPQWEKKAMEIDIPDSAANLHTGRLVPIYPETAGLTSKWLRRMIAQILPEMLPTVIDPLPEEVRGNLLPLPDALQQIHFPKTLEEAQKARDRLAFDELFFIQVSVQKRRRAWQDKKVFRALKVDQNKLASFIDKLPFELTGAQERVIREITDDLQKPHPMNRLLQGEVGSGKTVVAAALSYLVSLNGLRTIIMAPTEILAFQHLATFTKLLEPYGLSVGIYTGSRKSLQKTVAGKQKKTSSHNSQPITKPDIIIGTHALLSQKLQLDKVGLVVVDEQQRFGVEHRSILRTRAKSPHFLTMTATPIPRTVALTLYGDLDISVIDELPRGRQTVRTYFVPQRKREDAYKFIAKHVRNGEQVYIITPLIEQSETLASVKAATVEYERLKKEVFPQFRLGLLHGRMKSKEKEEVITKFKNQKIDILVSTSVVEVGVDVQSASIMVVEGAERFGLAQLHQLRGRVGRGKVQSYTFLFTGQENPFTVKRLKNLEKIHNGLKLAELDMQIRGSGEVFGLRQSGEWNLKIASLSDLSLIEKTRDSASKILKKDPNLDKHPQLAAKLTSGGKEVFPD